MLLCAARGTASVFYACKQDSPENESKRREKKREKRKEKGAVMHL